MTLRDVMAADLPRTFLNVDEFGESCLYHPGGVASPANLVPGFDSYISGATDWTTTGITETDNQHVDSQGALLLAKLDQAGGGPGYIGLLPFSVPAAGTYTYSVEIYSGTSQRVMLEVNQGGVSQCAYYDVAVGAAYVRAAYPGVSATIVSTALGFWRCYITVNLALVGAVTLRVYPCPQGTTTGEPVAGGVGYVYAGRAYLYAGSVVYSYERLSGSLSFAAVLAAADITEQVTLIGSGEADTREVPFTGSLAALQAGIAVIDASRDSSPRRADWFVIASGAYAGTWRVKMATPDGAGGVILLARLETRNAVAGKNTMEVR